MKPPIEIDNKSKLAMIVCSLSVIAIFTKFFGLAEKFVIAHFFGTSDASDIYFASTTIMFSIVFLVKELIYPSLLPVFADSLLGPVGSSASLFRKTFFMTVIILVSISLSVVFFSEQMTSVFVRGFSDPKRWMMACLLKLLGPAILFQGLSAVTYTVLNAHKKFIRAAWPEAALKFVVVLGLVVLSPIFGIYAYAIALGLGAFGCLVTQLFAVPEYRYLLKSKVSVKDDRHFRRVLILMAPLTVGVISSHTSGLVDNYLASTLDTGQLSYLGYSKKLIDAILLIGPVALVTVVYSQLSHLAAAKEHQQFISLVSKAFRLIIYLSMPVAFLLTGMRRPLIMVLLQRGQFTIESTVGTSQAFMVYALGLTIFSLEPLLVHSFFALSNTKTPVVLGVLCVCLDITLAMILLRHFEYIGIALAVVISKTAKVVLLAILLDRRLGKLFSYRMLYSLTKQIATSYVLWVVAQWVIKQPNPSSWFYVAVFDLVLPSGVALAVFTICSYALRIDEFGIVIDLLKRKKAASVSS